MRIYTRAEWGAAHRAGFGDRAVGSLDKWLHHSVTSSPGEDATFEQDAATIRQLEGIGQSRFKGGISYTFAVCESGRVFEGHGVGRIGAHTKGRNTGAAGIVLVGNYQGRPPTRRQLEAVAALLVHGVDAGWWRLRTITGGHRDVVATGCPGDEAYPLIGTMNALAAGGVVPVTNPVGEPPAPAPSGLPVLRYGSRGIHVAEVQRYLGLKDDGIFGPATRGAVRTYQAALGLTVDGIVGPVTWGKIRGGVRPAPPKRERNQARSIATQRAVHAHPDSFWGDDTDRRVNLVRAALNGHYPEGVAVTQGVVGTAQDGAWGKKSRAALVQTVRELQAAWGTTVDGVWGPNTEAAWVAARAENYKVW